MSEMGQKLFLNVIVLVFGNEVARDTWFHSVCITVLPAKKESNAPLRTGAGAKCILAT